MTEAEMIKLIRTVIKREIAPILMANVVENKNQNRSSIKRFENDGPTTNLRNIQPYGISSRAPAGTQCLTVPVGGNATHLNMVGHFDEGRPVVPDGSVALYDSTGKQVFVSGGEIHLGSQSASSPVSLGDILQSLLSSMLDEILSHTHTGNLGYPTSAPINGAAFAALKASPVDDGAMNSSTVFVE